jgi:thiol-disulfide isomerase/thioredoxin
VKRIFITIVTLFIAQLSFSQADSTKPLYLRFPAVPQFTIFKAADSTAFTRENLHKKKPVVFILFSPDCEHCQHETKELIANLDKFKNTQIVMITYMPYDMMKQFYRDYKIADYPLITMGRDGKYMLPTFFNVHSLPAIYVYDKKGKFKQAFEGSVKIDKIVEAL